MDVGVVLRARTGYFACGVDPLVFRSSELLEGEQLKLIGDVELFEDNDRLECASNLSGFAPGRVAQAYLPRIRSCRWFSLSTCFVV